MMRNLLALTAILSLSSPPALSQSSTPSSAIDTSSWACEYCQWPTGVTGEVAIGAGWVSEDAFRFGHYTGLEEGSHPVLDGALLHIDDAHFWRLDLDSLGLDARRLALDGGQPGRWRLAVSWSELPARLNNSGTTPYSGVGGGLLVLPEDWVNAPFTDQMETLGAASRPLSLASDRERFALGLRFTPGGSLDYSLTVKRDMKEGVRALGSGFLFTSTLLPAPVDYVTDQIEGSIGFSAGAWRGEVSYYGSFFDNRDSTLGYDNPFNPLVPGADRGQIALEPDNEFHRLGLSLSRAVAGRGRFSARLGLGRMTQDEPFLPYTLNPTPIAPIPLGALPRTRLDGEVDVLDLGLNYSFRLDSGWRLSVDYDYYERDNNSPVDEYTVVTQDLFVNEAQPNRPFSHERHRLGIRGSYRLSSARLSAGLGYQDTQRSLDTTADTDEIEGWARVNLPLGATFDAQVELRLSEREGDDLSPEAVIASTENPALRKFAYADRDRSELRVSLNVTPAEFLQLGWHLAWKDDDYEASRIGLSASQSVDQTLDVNYTPPGPWSLHAFHTLEDIDSTLANSATFSAPDWFATTDDRVRTSGIGIQVHDIGSRGVDLALDYVQSRSRGRNAVNDASAPPAFPDLHSRLQGTRLRVTWPLARGGQIGLDYYREELKDDDWTVDGLQPDTVFNVLGLGELSLDHEVDSLAVWYRSGF